jgi:hypothetical protein
VESRGVGLSAAKSRFRPGRPESRPVESFGFGYHSVPKPLRRGAASTLLLHPKAEACSRGRLRCSSHGRRSSSPGSLGRL